MQQACRQADRLTATLEILTLKSWSMHTVAVAEKREITQQRGILGGREIGSPNSSTTCLPPPGWRQLANLTIGELHRVCCCRDQFVSSLKANFVSSGAPRPILPRLSCPTCSTLPALPTFDRFCTDRMPPKAAKGGPREEVEAPDVKESRRLTERAFDVGVRFCRRSGSDGSA